MRRNRRKQKDKAYRNQTRIQPNAYKVPSKLTRWLTGITIVAIAAVGTGAAFWIIHKVHQFKAFATPSYPSSGTTNTTANATRSTAANRTSENASIKPDNSVAPGATNTLTNSSKAAAPGNNATPNQQRQILPSKETILDTMMKDPLPASAMIRVKPQSQKPQLVNGCEVTSLSMLLGYVKHPVGKMTLAKEEPQDPTPLVMNKTTKQIISWGNPEVGFVGSVQGTKKYGYGIYHTPLTHLVNYLLPNRGLDLTGMPFKDLEAIVAGGTPVEVWDTDTFEPTNDWMTWKSPEGPVKATFHEHVVLLVGYTKNSVLINNPLNGEAAQKVPIEPFIEAWKQLGQQALTVSPKPFQQK